ncbi:MAG: ATP-binding protein [Prevotella sp.]|nr:ATP-binding protein [Candidatus Prevotella equi]
MERFVYQQLLDWKNSAKRKPLVLNGARQVGKTWLLKEFAQNEYAKMAYVVCHKNPVVKEIFKVDFNMDRILRALRALTGVDITPGDTLIVLDEIQDVPEALEALKYFREDAPDYHVAVAGSLLGLSMHKGTSYPVGQVNTINIYPMNFEEFLLAKGEEQLQKLLASKDYQTTNLLHEKYTDLLRQYFYVGGMPEAVLEYVTTENLQVVRKIQQEILRGYDMDFSKHAPSDQVARIRMVWQTIPSQLFRENKKFIFGAVSKGSRAKDFEIALQWLCDAGLAYRVQRVSKPELPLKIYEEMNAFKLYLLDVGLLGAMADVQPAQILVNNDIFKEYKGGMTEQYVLQQKKSQDVDGIYYHTTDASRLEIDFLMQRDGALLPIEVKAEGNVRSNSLTTLLRNKPELHAERYSMLPYIEQENMTNVPLYAV